MEKIEHYIFEFEKNILTLENLSINELIEIEKSIYEIKRIQEIKVKNIEEENILSDLNIFYKCKDSFSIRIDHSMKYN